MIGKYHTGELAVQIRAGVQDQAARIIKGVRSTIPQVAQMFLQQQQMIIVSTIDPSGRIWASLLSGESGFMKILDEETIEIQAVPPSGDPLAEYVQGEGYIGLLAIDLATRRRMRINGWMEYRNGSIVVHVQETFSNCPKYIQIRPLINSQGSTQPSRVSQTKALTNEQQIWIGRADTFFIASYHAEYGSDASHRGGVPGFVHVEAPSSLLFPDYSGNRMFLTLGNISADPRAGLIFPDFERGRTLQLTGHAQIIWDKERVSSFVEAERAVEFTIDEVIEVHDAFPLRGSLVEYSPFLPLR